MAGEVSDALTLGKALREAAAQLNAAPTPLLDARILLKLASGLDDAGVIAKSDDPLPADQAKIFAGLIKRRAAGEPVAYITGVKEFWSLEFRVNPDVLIPRDDSECLIEAVIARREKDAPYNILDLGTGSGCLLCALLDEFPNSLGTGVDYFVNAIVIARANSRKLGLAPRARFLVGDWARALNRGFDIIIANPPYIPERDRACLPVDVGGYEPASALFAGEKGFDAYRAILADAPRILNPGGLIVFEAGDGQGEKLAEMVTKTFREAEISTLNDLKGRLRGVMAERKSFAEKD
ncbi:Peptide chain release factor N(5)-glutamine methyltransferase [hydrothermal vent metagenome]|uniref:Peptide chain release factor N(5)-glutamine methyltransferase n=1 Tax=hydrothermal vent metagenome TaxID=652676 RepID=A0A3B0THB8_9ZZZZ